MRACFFRAEKRNHLPWAGPPCAALAVGAFALGAGAIGASRVGLEFVFTSVTGFISVFSLFPKLRFCVARFLPG